MSLLIMKLLDLANLTTVFAAQGTIAPGIPGALDPGTTGILGIVQNVYLLALGLAGVLAVGSITYGAIVYTVSQGSPDKLKDAWDRIVQAFVGILLLVGAGTILSIVNPGLLSLELPRLTPPRAGNYEIPEISLTLDEENELDETQDGWRKPTGGGACVDGAGTECAQDRMAQCASWDAAKASRVCMVESAGGNPLAKSGSDRCSTASGGLGDSFSLGLFQINVADHQTYPAIARLLPRSCLGLFTQGKGCCLDCRRGGSGCNCKGGVCYQWSCRMIGTNEQYEQCRQELAGPAGIQIACVLYEKAEARNHKPWQPWAWTAGKVCKMGLGA